MDMDDQQIEERKLQFLTDIISPSQLLHERQGGGDHSFVLNVSGDLIHQQSGVRPEQNLSREEEELLVHNLSGA